MSIILEWLRDDIHGTLLIDISEGICCPHLHEGTLPLRNINEEMIHEQITILLTDEMVVHALGIFMMITGGKSILALTADPLHGIALAVFNGNDLPTGIGIEHIRYDGAFATGDSPVGGIALAVEVGIGVEERHLLVGRPESSLVIVTDDLSVIEAIYVIAIRCATDIDIALPDISAGGSMTVFHEMLPLKVYLVVDGEMRMTAEQFKTSLERSQHLQQQREVRRRVMALLRSDIQRRGLTPRIITECQGDMIAQNHFLGVGGQCEILAQPRQLTLR